MQVNYAFLCDYADQSGKKISALGIGFDTIYANKVPAAHPLFFAVISIRFESTEIGSKRMGVRIIDADGKNLVPPLDTTIELEPPPAGFTYRSQGLSLAFYGVEFPHYGDYSVRWLVNGTEVKDVSLKVALPPIQSASP